MGKNIETYIVDSFTDEPFKGNPAGVCLLEQELTIEKMAAIANELGLSETAFVLKKADQYTIRYFSPKMEIPLCGHATLAASKVLFEKYPDMDNIHFTTVRSIDLLTKKDGDSIIMEFPIYDTMPAIVPHALLDALGIMEFTNGEYNLETQILLVEIPNSITLENLKPDFEALYKSHDSISGVLVTAPSSRENFDFESRYFWPWSGTNEDPVTGGTHTFLAKYWGQKLGKTTMNSFQCSPRTGFMEVTLINDKKFTIKSVAQIIFKGELFVNYE